MKAVLLKEINSFFGSVTGYLVIGVFLVANGLFLWIFDGNFNILNSGYNDLTPFFRLTPWALLFLVPAITMKSFSEERKQGTIELLLTRPISLSGIVGGKLVAALLLVVIAVIPTLLYVFILNPYGNPAGNLDLGSTVGSYFGLFLLAASYASIGVFSSACSENQIVAFILAIILCFIFFSGFDELSGLWLSQSVTIEKLGMNYHYKSLSRGVIDTRDMIYFFSILILFFTATIYKLNTLRK